MKQHIIILLLILIGGVTIYYAQKTTFENITKKQTVISYEKKALTEKYQYLSVEGYYPRIAGVPESVNTEIKTTIDTIIKEAEKTSKENNEARKEIAQATELTLGSLSFNITYPKEPDTEFISFILQVSGYTGGAHGFLYYVPFNFNPLTGEKYTTARLLALKNIKIEELSKYARPLLKNQIEKKLTQYNTDIKNEDEIGSRKKFNWEDSSEQMLTNGTKPESENFKNIIIGKNEIELYFEPYQIASWAEGEFSISIPYSEFTQK